jgi:hypothetical protein
MYQYLLFRVADVIDVLLAICCKINNTGSTTLSKDKVCSSLAPGTQPMPCLLVWKL